MCGRLCMGGIIARPFANIKAIIVRVSVQTCWCQNTSRLRKNSSNGGIFFWALPWAIPHTVVERQRN